MNVISINKKDRTPLYLQIQQSILDAIHAGELRNNNPLPYEEDVSSFYRISRQVVRQAYNELEKEGYIIRIRRKGTFVHIKPVIHFNRKELINFKLLLESRGFSYSRQLLLSESIFVKNSNFPYCFKKDYNHAIRIVYTLYANGQPFALHEMFIPGIYSVSLNYFRDPKFNLSSIFELLNLPVEIVTYGMIPHVSTNVEALSIGVKLNSVLSEHALNYSDISGKALLFERFLFDSKSCYVDAEVQH